MLTRGKWSDGIVADHSPMQIKVSWPAENAANELLSLTLFGGYAAEA